MTAEVMPPAAARRADRSREISSTLLLFIHNDLRAIESEWRRFERIADCTAFQAYDWLATWQRNIGEREGTVPVIAVGSFTDGETAFILPLAVERKHLARRLCWLGQDHCDYTAPLLARDFAQRVTPERFRALWKELLDRLQRDPQTRHDWINLENMPHLVCDQVNPFTHLGVTINPSGAHLTYLGDDWEKFYFEKRSSATRRHDRAKRRHLSEFGEISFVDSADTADACSMVETLMHQKSRSLARKGILDIFARPGCREFFLDLAANPRTRHLIHISRIEIGATWAAVNMGLVFGDSYYHVLASFDDSELAHYGPGALHLRELMAYAIRLGLHRFDFTVGDEPYKLEWSDTHLKLCDFIAAVTWRGRPASLWSKGRRRIKRFVKQTPAAWRTVCAVRSVLGFLRAGTR